MRRTVAALPGAQSTGAVAGKAIAATDLSAFLSMCHFSGFMKLLHIQPLFSTQGWLTSWILTFFFQQNCI